MNYYERQYESMERITFRPLRTKKADLKTFVKEHNHIAEVVNANRLTIRDIILQNGLIQNGKSLSKKSSNLIGPLIEDMENAIGTGSNIYVDLFSTCSVSIRISYKDHFLYNYILKKESKYFGRKFLGCVPESEEADTPIPFYDYEDVVKTLAKLSDYEAEAKTISNNVSTLQYVYHWLFK